MTQEEYEREQQEIQRLINEINALVRENNRLVEEINYGLRNISILEGNVVELHRRVEPKMNVLSGEIKVNSNLTEDVRTAIEEMASQYLTFKTLSTASKDLTQYTDAYNTKFSYYNHLRRITLGYVIGLDSNFVSDENMRLAVEKAYLQNTEYWLAYATMAVMLWASNEKEAAERALDKAMFISPQKATLYFMMINLRFARTDVARNWFLNYMDKVNPSDLGEEWQYLLQSYLAGVFGEDESFEEEVRKFFKKMLVQSEAVTVNFNKRFIDRAYSYASTYLHRTSENFAYLKGTCKDYEELVSLLSNAEKNAVIAKYYDDLLNEVDDIGEDIAQRIENVLYSLINEYDKSELEVVKKIKKSEYIISAQGDMEAATKKFEEEFGEPKNRNFADYLTEWAFVEDSRLTPLSVRRFSIAFMKDWIFKGYEKFAEENRNKVKKEYEFNVDGCIMTASEDDFPKCKETIEKYYEKNKWGSMWEDKMTKIYGLITLVGVLALVIMVIQLSNGHFSPVALTLGLLLVLVGAFLLWRQIVAVLEQVKEKKRLSIQKIKHALTELGQWRQLFRSEDENLSDLKDALMRFGEVQE